MITRYKCTNIDTGEVFIGKSDQVSEHIGIHQTSVTKYVHARMIYHKVWKIEKYDGVYRVNTVDYSEYNAEQLKKLQEPENITKLRTLWDAYKSGRSVTLNLNTIADEFNVHPKAIIKALEKEGKI